MVFDKHNIENFNALQNFCSFNATVALCKNQAVKLCRQGACNLLQSRKNKFVQAFLPQTIDFCRQNWYH